MVDVTVSRGSTSVDISLLSDGAQDPLLPVDIGKPNQNFQNSGALDPRVSDFWSVQKTYTILGRLTGSNAYDDAITLADLIKSNSDGTELTLDVPLPEFDSTFNVAPAVGVSEALSLAYPPGGRDRVDVELSLTRINSTLAGATQNASTPTATGTGPIQLIASSNPIDLTPDVTVNRLIGRPKSTIGKRSDQTFPVHIDHQKAAYDAFELSYKEVADVGLNIGDLATFVETIRGRDSLALDFNGIYGMGQFDVVFEGSNALRHVRQSGEGAVSTVPTINLRRVTT